MDIQQQFELKFQHLHEIIVFTHYPTNRLIYTLDFLIKRVWQKNYLITTDENFFIRSDKIKMNYSEKYFDNTINIFPSSLLQKTDIDKSFYPDFQTPANTHYKEDILSKIFYSISRYEEWQENYSKDKHQRFEADASIFKNIMQNPFLDEAIQTFKQYVQTYYSSFQTNYFYQEIYSFDLDNILAFKGKNIIRTTGALIKHLLKKEYNLFSERIKVLQGRKKDPIEYIYQYLQSLSTHTPLIFFILSRSDTKYDRAAELQHPYTKKILHTLKNFATIALHPSYYSSNNESVFIREKNKLEKIIQQKIIASRQHYLRMNIRTTPQILIQQNIHYDFTMGFASKPGFRAGTSYPFYYYNFEKEQATNLLFVPFCAMDGAYFNYNNINTSTAIQQITQIKNTIQQMGGYFIPLFHETTLCPLFNKSANEWKKIFQPLYNTI